MRSRQWDTGLWDADNPVVVEHKGGVPVCGPLDHDEDAEISKDRVEEDHLRDEDEVHGDAVLEVEAVHEHAAHTSNHLGQASDDCKLHLE